jgi:hypothetical protein
MGREGAIFEETRAETKNRLCASRTKSEFNGQVGQESNLHPAVLEFALPRSLLFVDVRQSRNFLGMRTPAFATIRHNSPQLASKLASNWHQIGIKLARS